MAEYKLISCKGTWVVNGTIEDVTTKARKLAEEYQPAFGVSIEDGEGNTVGELE